jgi:hypothetical protein
MYYSNLSHSVVSEEEAHVQIIQFCEKWFRMTQPEKDFENYFIQHPDLIQIERWSPSFVKLNCK